MSIQRVWIGTALVEKAGSATAYFQRLLLDIIDTLNGQSGASGVATVAPNGSGDATITHGFSVPGHAPTIGQCLAFPTGATAFVVQIQSVTATSLNIRLFDMAGAAITTGSYNVAWKVSG